MHDDFERCYRAVLSRDARFDGWFFVAVRTTGIYCRPSCPATTPKRENVGFHPTSASAQLANYRACKRCRPDATPGSPAWNSRADAVGRAMRLIADGVVDREGVRGLAQRLAYSERHLHRLLIAEVGAGPLALARAQRAQTARILIETTDLPFGDVAFAAGFESIRQFNDTVREIFASTPTAMRSRRRVSVPGASSIGEIVLRLPCRAPFDGQGLLRYLARRAVPGVEEVSGDTYRRTLSLSKGWGIAALTPSSPTAERAFVSCRLRLEHLSDLGTAVQRCRRLLDLDADPAAVDGQLGRDSTLASLIAQRPGRRSPGGVDGTEIVVRAILGQQVSLASAAGLAGQLVLRAGAPLPAEDGELTHLFPSAAALAAEDPARLPMPARRAASLTNVCQLVAQANLDLEPGTDRERLRRELLALPGIGPWTAAYVTMRAAGDPDVFLPTDLGVRHALQNLGLATDAAGADQVAMAWRPWRSYAVHHLWASLEGA